MFSVQFVTEQDYRRTTSRVYKVTLDEENSCKICVLFLYVLKWLARGTCLPYGLPAKKQLFVSHVKPQVNIYFLFEPKPGSFS